MVTSGIDKTYITGIFIESVNFEKLNHMKMKKSGKIRLERDPDRSFYRLRNGDSFEYIKIQDDKEFTSFVASYKIDSGMCIPYAQMEISVATKESGNKYPLSIEEYKEKLIKIFDYLHNVYGVRCNMDDVKFKTLELNANIQLNNKFDDYIRILQILMDIAPKTYKRGFPYKDRVKNTIDYMVIGNKSLKVKFYNKSSQLKEVYELDTNENLLRIEYTLLTDTKVRNVFGTNKVNELSNYQIKNFITNQFINDFAKPYDKLKRENRIRLKRLIDKCKSENKNWINKIKNYFWLEATKYNEIPIMLDIEDFLELVKIDDKSNYSRNRSKILREFPNTYFNQHEKYEEIFSKVMEI